MAIAWLSVLQAVPWSDVISNAPKVAEGAKKLWSTVTNRPVPTAPEPAEAKSTAASPPAQALAALEGRVAALEATTAQMHGQLVASSALIKALAEQNAQLVQRIESNRVRLLWLAAMALAGLAAGIASLLMAAS